MKKNILNQDKGEKSSLFYNTLETISDSLLIADSETGKIINVNSAASKVLGYSKEELLNLTIVDISLNTESIQEWIQEIESLRRIKKPRLIADHLITKNKVSIPVEVSVNFHEENEKLYVVWIARDITERLNYSKALKQSEARFRELVETTNDWIWELNKEGYYTYISPSVLNILGYTPQEMLGKTPFDFMPAFEAKRVGAIFLEITKKEKAFSNLININLHKNGNEVIMETNGMPFFSYDGEVQGYRGIDRDVSDAKRQERLFQEITNSTFDGIVTLDEKGRILTWNQTCENIFGYFSSEAIGKEVHKFLTPHNLRSKAHQGHKEYRKNGKGPLVGKTQELPALSKNGDIIPIELTVTAMNFNNKWYAIGTLRDLREKKQLEEEKLKNEEMLIQQSRLAAMGEMIANIAHQWRQPISSIGIAVQNIQIAYDHGKLNGKYMEKRIPNILEQIQYMSNTIDDFRNFFKPNINKIEFCLHENIQKSIELAEQSYVKNKIELIFTIDKSYKKTSIIGHQNEFSQVILSILKNAEDVLLERNIENPKVDITILENKYSFHILIEDNGGGIEESIKDNIFEPYFTTKGPETGTGIGLHMSKTIIEKHMNGNIIVNNGENGAQFIITLHKTNET